MRRGRGFGAFEKGVLLGVGAALLAGCAPSAQGDADATEGRPALTIGCDNYPPFCYLDEGGEYAGIDVDILTGALDRIGYGADFLQIEWDRKDELLSKRTIDGIASCFSMNGREGLYRWAGPYMQSRQVVAAMPESDIRTLADLKDKVVAVQVTTKLEEIFLSGEDKRIPRLGKVFSLEDRSLLYLSLGKGYVDAIAGHEASILQYEKDYDVKYRILDEPLIVVGVGYAFAKQDDRGIAEALDSALQQMHDDGTLRDIVGRYFDDPDDFLVVSASDD